MGGLTRLSWACMLPGVLEINDRFTLTETAYSFHAVRSSGPGGQHVNKVSTAVVLFFDVMNSPLPRGVKDRLLASRDHHLREDGVLVIKAQDHRSQDRNKQAALSRLGELIRRYWDAPKDRVATRRTKGSEARRLKQKHEHAEKKQLRGRVDY